MSDSLIFSQGRTNPIWGRSSALRELAKQLRLDRQSGHAAIADRHAEAVPPEAARALDGMLAEARGAYQKWGAYRSEHEAYGVLAEEMKELLDAIHANDHAAGRREALQIAAVAFRYALEGFER